MTTQNVSTPCGIGQCDIGLIGLGVMGRNFALNLADKGFQVAGYNRDPVKRRLVNHPGIYVADDVGALCEHLRQPRAVMMLVPAGKPVDDVIEALTPHLAAGDMIIDSGNSHFTDTDRRSRALEKKGLLFMGMGMSGGASGARNGPSLMPGGPEPVYRRVAAILEAAAAQVKGGPCVAYLGSGSAGHYVKMVHNGIEYGLMQLIAETYDMMQRGWGMHPPDLRAVYRRWREGRLGGYLMEITADIFDQADERTGEALIDVILDQAREKGTGRWGATDALAIEVPTLTLDTAVMMRFLSADDTARRAAAERFGTPPAAISEDRERFIDRLENALYTASLITYAQGMAQLAKASQTYGYGLDPATVTRVWSGGCIIRARLLQALESAYRDAPDLASLLAAPAVARDIEGGLPDLREVVVAAARAGIPAPGMMTALAYVDAYRSDRLPANLIMAQRDYFGSHTYQRVDATGTFHTEWRQA